MSQTFALAYLESNSSSLSCDCLAHRCGNAADRPDLTRCYGSDMTEAEWQVVRMVLLVPALVGGAGRAAGGYCRCVMLMRSRRLMRDYETLPAYTRPRCCGR